MSVKVEIPFKIHLAKAKDLPLSWYELILRPDKFAEHLQTLRQNPEALPNVSYLIVTFLDKSGVYSILCNSQSNTSFMDVMAGEKAVKLVKCALLVASSLHWDSSYIWNDLPLSVQYCLVSLLRNHFPSPEWDVVDSEGVAAHVIYSEWILKFVMSHSSLPLTPSRACAQTWDLTCIPPEQIKDMVRSKADAALSCLTEFLKSAHGGGDRVPKYWRPPRVSVDLTVAGSNSKQFHLEPFEEEDLEASSSTLLKERICQIRYVVGCYYFVVVGDYALAYDHLKEAHHLLAESRGCYKVNGPQLEGFLSACKGMGGERKGSDQEPDSEASLEYHLQKENFKEIAKMLTQQDSPVLDSLVSDNAVSALPSSFYGESEDVSPKAKRPKLSSSTILNVPLETVIKEKIFLCASLRRLINERPPDPRLWQLLGEGGGKEANIHHHVKFLLQLCDVLLEERELETSKTMSLQAFVRSVCCRNRLSWESFLDSKTAGREDSTVYNHFLGDVCEAMSGLASSSSSSSSSSSPSPSSTSSIAQLERRVSYATCPSQVTALVEELFKAIPASQHRTAASKWVGPSRLFAPAVEGVASFTNLTKYNCLIHRGTQMEKTGYYDRSLELFVAAHRELNHVKYLKGRDLLENLGNSLREQLLLVELLAYHQGACGRRGSTLRDSVEKRLSLTVKAKAYYTNTKHWSKVESVLLVIIGAYLLNTKEYSCFSLQPGHHTVPPRLAEAVVDVQKGNDTRKSIRALFEAVLFVFSPLLHGNEGKSEANERQSRLRANLDRFVRNLSDLTCLSLLAAALARIWNLLKKPEDEILTDFHGNWPTAIGNAASIDAGHIFRMLSTTINHALHVFPGATSWILIKANVHIAVGEYGAALERFLEAAALASNHFDKDIPEGVWSQVTLRRIISCCCKLGYYTQAVLLCQCLSPVDYDLAFSILKEYGHSTVDLLFPYFWDMTIIEYLIYIHSKKVDSHKRAAAIEVAGQQDLNFNNSTEYSNRAAQVRRRKFLRTFHTQVTHTL